MNNKHMIKGVRSVITNTEAPNKDRYTKGHAGIWKNTKQLIPLLSFIQTRGAQLVLACLMEKAGMPPASYRDLLGSGAVTRAPSAPNKDSIDSLKSEFGLVLSPSGEEMRVDWLLANIHVGQDLGESTRWTGSTSRKRNLGTDYEETKQTCLDAIENFRRVTGFDFLTDTGREIVLQASIKDVLSFVSRVVPDSFEGYARKDEIHESLQKNVQLGLGTSVLAKPLLDDLQGSIRLVMYRTYNSYARYALGDSDTPSYNAEGMIAPRITGLKGIPDKEMGMEEFAEKNGWINAIKTYCSLGSGLLSLSMTYPEDDLRYMTQTTEGKVSPVDVFNCMDQWVTGAFGRGGGGSMSRVNPLSNIAKKVKEQGAKPRTGVESLMVDESGTLKFIDPAADRLPELYSAQEEATRVCNDHLFTTKATLHDDMFIAQSGLPSNEAKVICREARLLKSKVNGLVFTDWVHNKLTVVDGDGAQSIIDITKWAPATSASIHTMLNKPVPMDSKVDDGITLYRIYETAQQMKVIKTRTMEEVRELLRNDLGAELPPTDPRSDYANLWAEIQDNYSYTVDGNMTYFKDGAWIGSLLKGYTNIVGVVLGHLFRDVERYGAKSTYADWKIPEAWEQLGFKQLSEYKSTYEIPRSDTMKFDTVFTYSISSESDLLPLRVFGEIVDELAKVIKSTPELMYKRYSFGSASEIAAMVLSLQKYGGDTKFEGLTTAVAEIKANTRMPEIPLDAVMEPIPLYKDITAMPHQVRAHKALERMPKFSILDVDAGGGKTGLILADALRKISKGVSPILILCPSHLVCDYINEASFMTKGRLNVIPCTSGSLDSWGYDKLRRSIEGAPANSVTVVDYDFLKGKIEKVAYGTELLEIGNNCEFLREFGFQAVYCDEAHYLKNASARSRMAFQLLAEIPYRCLATGTMFQTKLEDVINQVALLDPSIFGDVKAFTDKYANVVGGKVMSWRPGTEAMVSRKLADNACVISAKRKEWQSRLPPRTNKFHYVDLSPGQMKVYDAILKETLEEIQEDEGLMEMLNSGDESEADAIEAKLRPFLSRLESFLAAPMSDEISAMLLQGEDTKSVKGLKLKQIAEKHVASGIVGKILVFASYKNSAKEVYNSLGSDLMSKSILYTADNKIACRTQFKNDPSKILMIGVENSMNTGANFQFCSRLVRIESVWSPGTLEQGESRINRPQMKEKDLRTQLFFDWIIANKTIDVTKTGRLLARMVSRAKFENAETPRYTAIKDLDIVTMNLETIMAKNDVTSTLSQHFEAFGQLVSADKETYAEFAASPAGQRQPQEIVEGAPPAGSALMKHVPYVPGSDVFSSDELGLKSVLDYKTDTGVQDISGKYVHTDMGDARVLKELKHVVQVQLSDGTKTSIRKDKVFVITKTETSTKNIRDSLSQTVGMEVVAPVTWTNPDKEKVQEKIRKLPLNTPAIAPAPAPVVKAPEVIKQIETLPEVVVPDAEEQKTKDSPVPGSGDDGIANSTRMFCLEYNELLALQISMKDKDAKLSTYKKYGFFAGRASLFTKCSKPSVMREVVDKLIENFEISDVHKDAMNEAVEAFESGGIQKLRIHHKSSRKEVIDFYRQEMKPYLPNEIRPVPVVYGARAYIMLDRKVPAATKVRSVVKGSGIAWAAEDPFMIAAFPTKQALEMALDTMAKDGINISNLAELKENLAKIRQV